MIDTFLYVLSSHKNGSDILSYRNTKVKYSVMIYYTPTFASRVGDIDGYINEVRKKHEFFIRK